MTVSESTAALYAELLTSWDVQQTGYMEHREARFAIMCDALGTLPPGEFTVLDIGCGPGSLSQRILARYQHARCIGVDTDPVLLTIGRHAQAAFGDRLRWVDADLREPGWPDAIGADRVDAVVSTTALHWLEPGQLYPLCYQLGRLLRPGGLFLNGDSMPYDPNQPTCRRLADNAESRRADAAFRVAGIPDWDRWWADVLRVPELRAHIEDRDDRRGRAEARYGPRRGGRMVSLSTQLAALHAAAFTEVGTIWQIHDDRVLLAVR